MVRVIFLDDVDETSKKKIEVNPETELALTIKSCLGN